MSPLGTLGQCRTFVPVTFIWAWTDHVETPEASARTIDVCVRCHREIDVHGSTVVETYSSAGPFMVEPPRVVAR